jgi:1,4-dihydroxy-2-naphthoate octaprenyltransferase
MRTGQDECNLPMEIDVEKKPGGKSVVNLAYFHQIASVVKVLFKMARPTQLLLIILVYILGSLVARAHGISFNLTAFLFGLTVVLPVSASIHYANEYADHETDSLTIRTPFSGGSGALPESGLSPVVALKAAWIALIVGSFLGLLGWSWGIMSPAALAVLLWGAFWGWMYSLRPLALAWRGWGELDNAMLGGVALPVYAYVVQSGQLDWRAVLIFIPFGMLAFVNLLATTWADRQADAKVGKMTLATRWSITRLRLLYLVAAISAFLFLLLFQGFVFPQVVVLYSFLVLPISIWGFWVYTRQRSPFPTVAAMTVFLLLQIAAWGLTILPG